MNNKADKDRQSIKGETSNSAGTENKVPAGRVKTFASFSIPAFRTYYISMVGNWTAMSMQMLVRALLIYRLTGSAAMVGTISLAAGIPTIIVSLLGGSVGDRTQKKYILLWCRAGSSLITLIIGLTLVTGYLSVEHTGSYWVLIVTAIFDGIINGFLTPTNTSIIPEIVGVDRVMNGISLSQMGQNLFRLAGPAAAGYLIDNYNFASVYFLMTGMYVIATISTAFLPRTTKNIVRGGNAMKDVVGGLQYLKGDVIILMVVVFGVCHVVSGQPFSQMLPVFTESILNVSASKLGFLSVVSAAGALVTSLILASLPNKKRGVILIFSGAVMSIPIMIFCIYPQWSTAIIAMVFFGIGPTIHGAMTSTVVQSYVKPEYRSRMQSLVTMSMALASLGTFFAGILSDAVGVQWAVGSMALFLTLVSFGCYIFLPRFRKLN